MSTKAAASMTTQDVSSLIQVTSLCLGDWTSAVGAVEPTKPIIKLAKSLLDEAQVDLEAKSVRLAYMLAGHVEMPVDVRPVRIARAKREVREAEDRLASIHALSTGQNVVDWERVVTPQELLDIVSYFNGVDGGVDHE